MQKAMEISGSLTDEAVRNGSITKVKKRGNVGEPSKDKNGRDDNKRTRTGNDFATTTNPVERENMGSWPKCTTCNSYHAPGGPCRTCFNCNRPGHFSKDCRVVPRNVNLVNVRNPAPARGACNECGSTDHLKPACLRLNRAQGPGGNCPNQVVVNNGGQGHGNQGNQARGRAFMLGAEEARQDPNIVTESMANAEHAPQWTTVRTDETTSLSTQSMAYKFLQSLYASSTIPAIYIQQFWDIFALIVKAGSIVSTGTNKFGSTKGTLRDALQIHQSTNNRAFSSLQLLRGGPSAQNLEELSIELQIHYADKDVGRKKKKFTQSIHTFSGSQSDHISTARLHKFHRGDRVSTCPICLLRLVLGNIMIPIGKSCKASRFISAGEELRDPESPAQMPAKATKLSKTKANEATYCSKTTPSKQLFLKLSQEAGKVVKKRTVKRSKQLVDEFIDEGVPAAKPKFEDTEEAILQKVLEEAYGCLHQLKGVTLPPVYSGKMIWETSTLQRYLEKEARLEQYIFKRLLRTIEPAGPEESSSIYAELDYRAVHGVLRLTKDNESVRRWLFSSETHAIRAPLPAAARISYDSIRRDESEDFDVDKAQGQLSRKVMQDSHQRLAWGLHFNTTSSLPSEISKQAAAQDLKVRCSAGILSLGQRLTTRLSPPSQRFLMIFIWMMKHLREQAYSSGDEVLTLSLFYSQPEAELGGKPLMKYRRHSEPAWTIPSSDLTMPTNNWASALKSTYAPPQENSLLAQTGDMAMFIDWYNVSKPLLLGGEPGYVTIQPDFFFNKDLEYLPYGRKVGRPALSISKMKAAYYPDVGLEQLVPDQFWIEEECKYDIAAMYGISHWWFQRQRFYIDRFSSEGDRRAVRTHMRILSVVQIEVFSMYGYNYMKKIVLRRADLKEYVIAERDFKYMYPSDLKICNYTSSRSLEHFTEGQKHLLPMTNYGTETVIRQRVEYSQLGTCEIPDAAKLTRTSMRGYWIGV
ncbi:E-beta-farnesene synthase [Tanacetum coccineum]